MKDGIIKGNGTSRKIFANFPATYGEFRAQAAAGTLPLDVMFNPDGWQQQPDFLNQKNLYQRSTAAVYGLNPESSTPNDALYLIGRLNSGIGNEYLWERRGTEYNPVLDEDVTVLTLNKGDVVNYSDNIYYSSEDSSFLLGSPGSVTLLSAEQPFDFVSGQYITIRSQGEAIVYKCIEIMGGYFAPGAGLQFNVEGQVVTAQEKTGMLGYVNSPDPDAYPSDEVNGITYTSLGKIGDLARVESGSYTGDGTASKTLEFKVLPKFLFVYKSATNEGVGTTRALWAPGITEQRPNADSFAYTGFSANENKLTLSGNGSGLTDTDKAMLAFNQNGISYNYVALLGVSE